MTFDQWIAAVNAQVRAKLGDAVRAEEISWDSAIWVSRAGTAVATAADDGVTARLWFDGGEKLVFPVGDPAAAPELVGQAIAERLTVR